MLSKERQRTVLRLDISKDVNRALILLITTVVFIVSG